MPIHLQATLQPTSTTTPSFLLNPSSLFCTASLASAALITCFLCTCMERRGGGKFKQLTVTSFDYSGSDWNKFKITETAWGCWNGQIIWLSLRSNSKEQSSVYTVMSEYETIHEAWLWLGAAAESNNTLSSSMSLSLKTWEIPVVDVQEFKISREISHPLRNSRKMTESISRIFKKCYNAKCRQNTWSPKRFVTVLALL